MAILCFNSPLTPTLSRQGRGSRSRPLFRRPLSPLPYPLANTATRSGNFAKARLRERDRACPRLYRGVRGAAFFTALVKALLFAFLLTSLSQPALAVDPQEQLKDPALEARAREISAGLRCLVCQNQSIDDSDAPLARDLRLIVRQQLEKGATNDQVVNYVVARYGEFVLLSPRLRLNTVLLWLTPIVLIAVGVLLAARVVRRHPQKVSSAPLTLAEEKELTSLLTPPGKSDRR
jgi:cytochrome c-type biogenesis protein CcmH